MSFDESKFLDAMNKWSNFVILVDSGSEEYVNKKLRDFISYWEFPQENPNKNWGDSEYLSEENQDMIDEINSLLPEPYQIGYAPHDPGSVVIAKSEWWENEDG